MVGLIPWPPPVADMSAAYSAEDHFDTYGGGAVYEKVTNKVTGVAAEQGSMYAANITDEEPGLVGFPVFTNGYTGPSFPEWALYVYGGSPCWVYDPTNYATAKSTEILFLEVPLWRSYDRQAGGFDGVSGLFEAYLVDGVIRNGARIGIYNNDIGYRYDYWLTHAYQPWSMLVIKRDNTITADNGDYLSFKQNAASWWNKAIGHPVDNTISAIGHAGIGGAVLMLRWERVLTDAEIDSIYQWAGTWLPAQRVPATWADVQQISTFATVITWDEAHGPAQITAWYSDHYGPIHQGCMSGFVDMRTPEALTELQDYITFDIRWELGFESTPSGLVNHGPTFPLDIVASEVLDKSATFTIPAAQTFDILAFRDGVMTDYAWLAGQTSFTDIGLEASVLYHYDFQQANDGVTVPGGWSVVEITTVAPLSRAIVSRDSTFTYSASWDMATHGPALIVASDGRQWVDAVSPWTDLGPVSQDATPYTLTFTWADQFVEPWTFERAAPLDLGIAAILVSHESATFTLPIPQTYEIAVYRDGLPFATIPPNAVEWIDTPLNAGTPYAYRFEQIPEGDTIPTGWAEESITTREVSAPSSEYWISQGGVWVKASSAHGAVKGEWVPVT